MPVPPDAVAEAVPSEFPQFSSEEDNVILIAVGSDTVVLADVEHPDTSVTVTVYVLAISPLIDEVV